MSAEPTASRFLRWLRGCCERRGVVPRASSLNHHERAIAARAPTQPPIRTGSSGKAGVGRPPTNTAYFCQEIAECLH
jgi:hypothetical protein